VRSEALSSRWAILYQSVIPAYRRFAFCILGQKLITDVSSQAQFANHSFYVCDTYPSHTSHGRQQSLIWCLKRVSAKKLLSISDLTRIRNRPGWRPNAACPGAERKRKESKQARSSCSKMQCTHITCRKQTLQTRTKGPGGIRAC
jgi:hypothetical protein